MANALCNLCNAVRKSVRGVLICPHCDGTCLDTAEANGRG